MSRSRHQNLQFVKFSSKKVTFREYNKALCHGKTSLPMFSTSLFEKDNILEEDFFMKKVLCLKVLVVGIYGTASPKSQKICNNSQIHFYPNQTLSVA